METTMDEPTHSTFEADLRELARVKRLQHVLEVPAQVFEATAPDCEGTCEHPTYVVLSNGLKMPCCAFRIAYDLKLSAESMERIVQRRVDLALHEPPSRRATRKELISRLALNMAMPRDFTGTGVRRRREMLSPEHEAAVAKREKRKQAGQ